MYSEILRKISGYTNFSSSYYVALEAWRRGLSVTFIKNTDNYYISSNERTLFFCRSGMIGGLEGLEYYNICKDKYKTKLLLKNEGVPTSSGYLLSTEEVNSFVEKAEIIGYPVVLKPFDGAGGENVYSDIKDEASLIRFLEILKSINLDKLIIEKHIDGPEYRAFVIGDEVYDIYEREPANIIGNGINTVKELIDFKNEQRSQHPHLRKKLIELDEEINFRLHEYDYQLDSIIGKGEKLYLRTKRNLSRGGDLVDVTQIAAKSISETAIAAVKSIPNLTSAGVDLIYDKQNDKAYVLEINSLGDMGGHHLSTLDTNKEKVLASPMIDYYFPESMDNKNRFSEFYFDQLHIQSILQNYPDREYTVKPLYFDDYKKILIETRSNICLDNHINELRDMSRRLYVIVNIYERINVGVFTYDFLLAGEKKNVDSFREWFLNKLSISDFENDNYETPIISRFIYKKM